MLQGPLSNLVLLDIFTNDVEESAHWLQNGFLVHHQPIVLFLQSNIAVSLFLVLFAVGSTSQRETN